MLKRPSQTPTLPLTLREDQRAGIVLIAGLVGAILTVGMGYFLAHTVGGAERDIFLLVFGAGAIAEAGAVVWLFKRSKYSDVTITEDNVRRTPMMVLNFTSQARAQTTPLADYNGVGLRAVQIQYGQVFHIELRHTDPDRTVTLEPALPHYQKARDRAKIYAALLKQRLV